MLFNTIVQLLTTLEAILEEITSPIQMLLLLHQDSTRISPGEQVVLRAEEIEVEEGVDFGLAHNAGVEAVRVRNVEWRRHPDTGVIMGWVGTRALVVQVHSR